MHAKSTLNNNVISHTERTPNPVSVFLVSLEAAATLASFLYMYGVFFFLVLFYMKYPSIYICLFLFPIQIVG